ncbi:glycoside hydrolase family 55 protein [Pseudooceanicola sp. CBS1P-1]|uniref:Rhamnogalacturonase A/B/Epimerase-like pectate lyase domain-containing protein n=1 Tax=Pseudooceanicola albus TaxID=2692189 RepID=A0A6L7GDD2_9RHOB|nr:MULTISPECIES: glycosyl hydrolase family 28-related protein [Pseudooceanicola]MBT9386734.1 glycoside hydrolase family 55 protein [Pseudooceanicola endophyticus]MXN20783.1 hypothetical protein [Pseudooceanicola albus]
MAIIYSSSASYSKDYPSFRLLDGRFAINFKDPTALLNSEYPPFGEGNLWECNGYRYEEASVAATDYHVKTVGGVKLYVVTDGLQEINVRAFGVTGDGITDDAPALNRAIEVVQNSSGMLVVPPGVYRYGSELQITDALIFRGAGLRRTIFQPMDGYSGWFMSITETNFVGSSNNGPVVNLSKDGSGVHLMDFSVRSSRDLNTGAQHGIRCIGRNDRMRWRNVYVECLEGTHFYFGFSNGTNSEGNPAASYIRECDFYNIESRGGGNSSTGSPAIVFNSYGVGDATNLCNFYGMRMVYPYAVGIEFRNDSTGQAVRRLKFFGLLLHGPGSTGITATDPLMRLRGRVSQCDFYSLQGNSTNAGQSAIRMQAENGYIPQGHRFWADISSGSGDTFDIDGAKDIYISCTGLAGAGVDFTVGANVAGPIIIDTMGQVPTTSFHANTAHHVSSLQTGNAALPARLDKIILGGENDSPHITHGDLAPEGQISAPVGSLYVQTSQDTDRDSDSLYVKRAGTGSTGWESVMLAVGGGNSSRPVTPTPYQYYFDNNYNRPVFADQNGNWIDVSTWTTTKPTSQSSTGRAGQVAADSSYIYVCVSANNWVRCPSTPW